LLKCELFDKKKHLTGNFRFFILGKRLTPNQQTTQKHRTLKGKPITLASHIVQASSKHSMEKTNPYYQTRDYIQLYQVGYILNEVLSLT
jgi:hypothetical protein